MSESTTFADLLRRHRLARSLTQEQLAERARITAKAVGALERGERRRPYPHTVRALARALALGGDELAELEDAVPFRVTPRGGTPPRTPATQGRELPAPPGPVVGREDEIGLVTGLLRSTEPRLITLVGTGGVGKTILALVAADAARSAFPGGVVMVELAGVSRGEHVIPTIRTALGVPGAAFDETGAAWAPYLSGARTLLVLDTVEHVLSCGPDIAALVASVPDLVVLCTSRAPLRVRVEHQVRVAPLTPVTAIELFRDRVAAAGRALEEDDRTQRAMAALCARTDGLPLAVELAASAAARLTPSALLGRLDLRDVAGPRDLPARQRSLAATVEWSLALLGAPARSLLARLSVCAGDFSLATVESVGADAPDVVLTALSELLEHSLVMRVPDVEGTERFRMLGPVRQYVADHLTTAGCDADRVAASRGTVGAAVGGSEPTARRRFPA